MFKIDNHRPDLLFNGHKPAIKVSKSTLYMVQAVDNFDAQPFNRNEAGWVRNDLSQLARAQSVEQYNMILSRLQELRNDKSLPADMSNEDAIKLIRPSYAQTPDELINFAKFIAQNDMTALNEAYEKSTQGKVDTLLETSSASSSSE